MNATNRVGNRVLLAAVGAILLAAAGVAVVAAGWPGRAAAIVDAFEAWIQTAAAVVVPGTDGLPLVAAGAFVLAVVLIVLLVCFIATRGGGRVATAFQARRAGGRTVVDESVADAVLAGPLRRRADVLTARAAIYRVRRERAVLLTLRSRRGADLAEIIRDVERAVAEWDALVPTDTPIVLHLADRRPRDRWRSATRVR